MRIFLFVLFFLSIIAVGPQAQSSPPLYRDYNALLFGYVCRQGVAYDALAKHPEVLEKAKAELNSIGRNGIAALTRNDQIAYYINLYNLYTIDLILRHLPLAKGIRDIADPWGVKFIPQSGGGTVSLDNIEHDILRKRYKEPRIHFTLVCASKSCPVLQNIPYMGDSLDAQFKRAAVRFLSDTTKNSFEGKSMNVSKIFDWYGDDFKKDFGSFQSYISKVLARPVGPDVHFNKYDWSLNKVSGCQGAQ